MSVRERELVAVVENRCPAQREQHEQSAACQGLVAVTPAGREASNVVVRACECRPGAGRQGSLCTLDDLPECVGLEARIEQLEVEGHVELVRFGSPERRPPGEVPHPGFAYEYPRRVVAVCQRTPRPVDLVHVGPVGVVERREATTSRPGIVVLGRRRVVAKLPVLDERVGDVDPEAGDPAVEPEAKNALELLAHLRVPPVEVGLLGCEVVQVVTAALRVERPRGAAAEGGKPVVRDLATPHRCHRLGGDASGCACNGTGSGGALGDGGARETLCHRLILPSRPARRPSTFATRPDKRRLSRTCACGGYPRRP